MNSEFQTRPSFFSVHKINTNNKLQIPSVPSKLGSARIETQHEPPTKRENKEGKLYKANNTDIISGSKDI
jgi:hypothetical protein